MVVKDSQDLNIARSRSKISNTLKNNKQWVETMKSKEYRDKLSKSLMGHEGYGKGVPRSQDVKEKIRKSVTGDKNHFLAKLIQMI
jgi:hypothetical protein